MKNKIIVTGSKGQVGRELTEYLTEKGFNVIGLSKEEMDITKIDSIEMALMRYNPAIIVNPAAYTNVDQAERERDLAYQVNREGPKNLSIFCKKNEIPLIHISTDYVFDGKKDVPYSESDNPNPLSEYGKSKLEGEMVVRENMSRFLIIRISWVFGIYGKNYVKSVLNWAKERDLLNIVSEQVGTPTYVTHLCEAISIILERYLKGEDIIWGIYHFCDSPPVSRYDFTNLIIDEAIKLGFLEKYPIIKPVPMDFFPTPARRPQNSSLNCQLMMNNFHIPQKEWLEGVKKIIEVMKSA